VITSSTRVVVIAVLLGATVLGSGVAQAEESSTAVCPPATAAFVECYSHIDSPGSSFTENTGSPEALYPGSGVKGGLSPQDLRDAYKLPSTGGIGQTIAIVDPTGGATAEKDLQIYRSHYGLPECTSQNGCFKRVLHSGNAEGEEYWSVEVSLDLDMASAICPECHIMLIETNEETIQSLSAAEDEAVELGATVISNSWGQLEQEVNIAEDSHYDHPGIPIVVASGDSFYSGVYGAYFPASAPTVISVGGTELERAETPRGWSETVWASSGGGCTEKQPKPAWQTDTGCAHRTENDVAAVASGGSPVSVYDSQISRLDPGETCCENAHWLRVWGTSAAAPIIAGIEGLSSSTVRSLGPKAFYLAGPKEQLFDITEGENSFGECKEGYLCKAETGYDSPSGWGTPNGLISLPPPPTATTESASSTNSTKSQLNATVNPEGLDTHYYFEYDTAGYVQNGTHGTVVPLEPKDIGAGSEDVKVDQVIGGLKPSTVYHFRVVAENEDGKTYGKDESFTTFPPVSTKPASGVNSTHATLNGSVNPQGHETSYQFEYDTAKYEKNEGPHGISVPSKPKVIGSGNEDVLVSEALEGLQPKTVYHFRVVASNVEGTTYGEDETFTTWGEWSSQSTVNPTYPPPPATEAKLEGISCASSSMCMAVGENKLKGMAFVELWNGSNWEVPTSAYGEGFDNGSRYGVACTSTTSCKVVGTTSSSTAVAELWTKVAGTWTKGTQSAVNPEGATEVKLKDISCTSSSACTAVGSYVKSGVTKTLAERWNGSAWSIQTTPNPGSGSAGLSGVYCDSASSCRAVGSQESNPYAMSWNGTSWSTFTLPKPAGASSTVPLKISCSSSSGCTTVGYYTEGEARKTLAERYNGSTWSIQTTPNPSEAKSGVLAGSTLLGVSCASSSSCTAVGRYVTATSQGLPSEEKTLTESWGGSEWAIQTSPNPAGKALPRLNAVSCVSATSCEAIGWAKKGFSEAETVTLGESWNGTSWSSQSTVNPTYPPPPATEAKLEGISCASSSMCMAVGENKLKGMAFVELWNGSNWEVPTSAYGEGFDNGSRYGVACTSTTSCKVVGTTSSSTAVAELWTKVAGTWTKGTQSAVNPEGATEVKLKDISCTSSSACTAVGSYVKSGVTKTLAERWNGSAWSIQTTPNPGSGSAGLSGVYCDSASSCRAVGSQESNPYAMSWNGTSWSTFTLPKPAGASSTVPLKISCSSSSGCTTVGYYTEGEARKTLAERYNGSTWSIQTTPNPSEAKSGVLAGSTLLGVSCASSSSCTAVGRYVTATSQGLPSEEKTLTESWGGSEWAIQTSPNPAGKALPRLNAVSCVSATSCEAIGWAKKGFSEAETVTLGESYG
jgi:hypothetical protein